MQNNVAIEVRNLTKYYGDLLTVGHINFQVQPGEIFDFLGPNGRERLQPSVCSPGFFNPMRERPRF
jgi:ABC-type branched-subunit amino acid transport system ATPase component